MEGIKFFVLCGDATRGIMGMDGVDLPCYGLCATEVERSWCEWWIERN